MARTSQGKRASFVVRTLEDERGEISGVIERVATGAKEPFTGLDAISRVVERMLRREREQTTERPAST